MRLRTRLALAFALLAIVPLALVVPPSLARLRQILSADLDSRLNSAVSVTETVLSTARQASRRAVDELAQSVALEQIARDLHSGAPPAALVSSAEKLMRSRGMTVLSLFNADGITLSSGHLPARLGDPDPALFAVAGGKDPSAAVVIDVRSESGLRPVPALVAWRSLDYGELRIWVVGGTLLDTSMAEQVSRITGARVEISAAETVAGAAGSVEPPTEERVMEIAPTIRVKLAMSRAPLLASEAVLQRAFAALVGFGLLLAAALGVAVSRVITRPVEALTAAARQIAGGSFALRVEEKASGEVGELVRAFNQMTGDLQRTTEKLVASERVAAWQEVARRLAHEIKNPLTPIRMSLETLISASETRDPRFPTLFRESAGAVLEEVERLRRIVDEFSQFARLPKPNLSSVDLSDLVRQILSLHASPRPGITISSEVEPALVLRADRDQLTQVLLNLLRNAEEALGSAGRIHVRAVAAGSNVVIEVEDSGPGVRLEDRARIFEPYFTTKEAGTGLGLAIARRICEEHGGRLEVESEPRRGAAFTITLPRQAPAARAL